MKSVRHTRKKRQTGWTRSTPSPLGGNALWQSSYAGAVRSRQGRKLCLSVEFSLLPGFFSCFLSQSPTSCPASSTRQSPDESWVSPLTRRFTPHSPSVIAPQASSSPSSSFQESLLHSLTHSLSHPNPPPQACSKPSVCNSTGLVEGKQPLAAALTSPSLRTPSSLVSGRVVSRGEGDCQLAPTACKPLSASKAWMQIRSGRQPPAGPHPPCPSESINPMLFHKSNWHQASDSPTHRPAHPFPWKQPNRHERGPKRRDTGANIPEGQRGPVQERVALRLPGFLACLFAFPLSLLRRFLSKEG